MQDALQTHAEFRRGQFTGIGGADRVDLIGTGDARLLARRVAESLDARADDLRAAWSASSPIRHFVADGLLPDPLAQEVFRALPDPKELRRRSSLRERKKVGVALEEYAPLVANLLLCFHEPEVVAAVARIVGEPTLQADPSLYASGLSVMERGDFLNPHVDNSHDGDRRLYRALNLLYYVTPDWRVENGGNLELWTPEHDEARTVVSAFNRLVVMQTHRESWHSVSRVESGGARCCVSNYYFTEASPTGRDYRNVTTFAGRPEEPVKRALLRVDGVVLNALGRALPFLTRLTWHRRSEK